MGTYNIGSCGCCGSPCPVSWRFAPLNFEFQYINMGASWQTNLFPRTPETQIEVTFSDGTTDTVAADANFPGSYPRRVTSTGGYVTYSHGGVTCRAEWQGSWDIADDKYSFLATESNGTITYGQFETM